MGMIWPEAGINKKAKVPQIAGEIVLKNLQWIIVPICQAVEILSPAIFVFSSPASLTHSLHPSLLSLPLPLPKSKKKRQRRLDSLPSLPHGTFESRMGLEKGSTVTNMVVDLCHDVSECFLRNLNKNMMQKHQRWQRLQFNRLWRLQICNQLHNLNCLLLYLLNRY